MFCFSLSGTSELKRQKTKITIKKIGNEYDKAWGKLKMKERKEN